MENQDPPNPPPPPLLLLPTPQVDNHHNNNILFLPFTLRTSMLHQNPLQMEPQSHPNDNNNNNNNSLGCDINDDYYWSNISYVFSSSGGAAAGAGYNNVSDAKETITTVMECGSSSFLHPSFNMAENVIRTRATEKNEEKEKKNIVGRMKKATRVPRFAFQTRSVHDILDDGYRWRKYGQKAVKNSTYPRNTHHTCNVKKQVQRLSKDTSIVVTTYEGIHNHPCEKFMETLTPLLKQIQFLAAI